MSLAPLANRCSRGVFSLTGSNTESEAGRSRRFLTFSGLAPTWPQVERRRRPRASLLLIRLTLAAFESTGPPPECLASGNENLSLEQATEACGDRIDRPGFAPKARLAVRRANRLPHTDQRRGREPGRSHAKTCGSLSRVRATARMTLQTRPRHEPIAQNTRKSGQTLVVLACGIAHTALVSTTVIPSSAA